MGTNVHVITCRDSQSTGQHKYTTLHTGDIPVCSSCKLVWSLA
jgi:hypothetical protein